MVLSLKDIEKKILSDIAGACPEFSFRSSSGIFSREFNAGQHVFHIGLISQSQNKVKISTKIKVYIDEIDRLYMPYFPNFEPEDKIYHSTIGGNADRLISDTRLIHGFEKKNEIVREFTDLYIEAIRKDFFPWFERNSKIDHVYKVLSDNNHPDHTPATFHGQMIVRLAILLFQEKWNEYDKVETQLLKYLGKRYGKQFAPKISPVVEQLRRKVDQEKLNT